MDDEHCCPYCPETSKDTHTYIHRINTCIVIAVS